MRSPDALLDKNTKSRRDGLRMGVGAFAATALPRKARADIEIVPLDQPEASNDRRVEGQKIPVIVEPEYLRRMEDVFLTIPVPLEKEVWESLQSVLDLLPKTARFVVAARGDAFDREHVRDFFKRFPSAQVQVATDQNAEELWGQDYFEGVRVGGALQVLMPIDFRVLSGTGRVSDSTLQRLEKRRLLLERLFPKGMRIEAPFYFEGGDVTADKSGETRRIFLGTHVLRQTARIMSPATNVADPDQQSVDKAKQVIREFFQGSEVVFMGEGITRSRLMFHLDQGVLFLGENTVAIATIEETTPLDTLPEDEREQVEEARVQQSTYQKQLQDLGYTVVEVPHSPQDILHARFSLNAILFTDREKNKRRAIVPVYDGEYNKETVGPMNTRIHMGSKASRLKRVLEERGYEVECVPDATAAILHGSHHCVFNVMAELKMGERVLPA